MTKIKKFLEEFRDFLADLKVSEIIVILLALGILFMLVAAVIKMIMELGFFKTIFRIGVTVVVGTGIGVAILILFEKIRDIKPFKWLKKER